MPCRDDVLCMAFSVPFQESRESVKHFFKVVKSANSANSAKWRKYWKYRKKYYFRHFYFILAELAELAELADLSVSRFSDVYVSRRFRECIPGWNGRHLMEDMVSLLVGLYLTPRVGMPYWW